MLKKTSIPLSLPPRMTKLLPRYAPNEVIVRTVPEAENDTLPHYLNVASGFVPPSTSYGDNNIDAAFHRLHLHPQSIARVFTPKSVPARLAELLGKEPFEHAEKTAQALARSQIPQEYDDEERRYGFSRTYRIQLENNIQNVEELCIELRKSVAIENARPNFISEVFARPNDELYGKQWGLQAIDCEDGWEIETGQPEVLLAIVDSGIDQKHDDLNGKIQQGYDFVDYRGNPYWPYYALGDYEERDDNPGDEDGHGTHCAGIAAATSNNTEGVSGISWRTSILPIRVMFRAYVWFGGYESSIGTDSDIDAGIKFAVDSGASLVNLSLGGGPLSHEEVLNYAYDKGVCVMAATGNENSNDPSYPASHPKVLAVGAVDQGLQRANFSNYGPAYNRFVMAPGVDILSTYKNNTYESLSGTSMATPFATGLAALVISLVKRSGKTLRPDDVYEIIRETATPLGNGKGDTFHGEGLINVKAALEAAKERCK